MNELGDLPYLVPAGAADASFLYDVFCTTWADEVAALPNPRLATHVLRIQHTAQERRFEIRHPGLERFVVLHDGEQVGRLYLHRAGPVVHAVDLTLLPAFRSRGIGTAIAGDLLERVREHGWTVILRVPRRNIPATALCAALGFRLVATDDLDGCYEWSPSVAGRQRETLGAARS
jgi:GNAT superfamily N-acetyltransferase